MRVQHRSAPERHASDPASRHVPAIRPLSRWLRTLTVSAGCCAVVALASLGFHIQPAGAQAETSFVPTFSTNSRVKQDVERLATLATQKRWDDWLSLYQQLVDDPRDMVFEQDQEFLIGLRNHCHTLLASQPATVRQRYRALYDAQAKKMLDGALRDKDPAAVLEVYARYPFSSSGPTALRWLADRALDEGRAEWARAAYHRLASDPAVTASTLLRYALAAQSAGKPMDAKTILDRVRKEYAAQPVTLGGKKLQAAEAAAQIAANLPNAAPTSNPVWSTFAGRTGTRQMPGGGGGKLTKSWEFHHSTTSDTSRPVSRFSQVRGADSSSRSRFSLLSFPVLQGDRIWIQGPRNLTSLVAKTGEVAWDEKQFAVSPDETGSANTNPRSGGIALRSGRPVQGAPGLDGHVLVTRMPLALGKPDGDQWPADYALVAFDGRSGSPLWRKLAGGEPRGMYYNLPTVRSNVILSGVATYKGGITEYNAVALDAGTGEVLWDTYLGGGSDPLGAVDGSPAAIHGDTVWVESTLYTLNALDLITGDVRLIYRYTPARRTRVGGFSTSARISNSPVSLIAATNDVVVFSPRWGLDVIALDPKAGKLLWSSPKGPGQTDNGALFAIDGQRAYICGQHVQAINLKDGAREWLWEPPATAGVIGYAALAGDQIVVPVDNRLYVYQASNGQQLEILDLAEWMDEPDSMPTVTLTGELVIFTTQDRVTAFRRE